MSLRRLRVGTRGSALALTQTSLVSRWLTEKFPGSEVETVRIRTTGDIRANDPISSMAGRGVFVDAIEQALLRSEIDFAVHSAKDLPPKDADGLTIAAYPKREDVRDVLITRDGATLRKLREGAVVGTSSRRRTCQIRAIRPDLQVVELRGNVDTRIRKLDEGAYDAIILAAAGLIRLSLSARITEWLPTDDVLPAPCQGALAVQTRANDPELISAFKEFNDPATVTAMKVERCFLATLGTGCAAPVAAYANAGDAEIEFTVMIQAEDGRIMRERNRFSRDAALQRAEAIAIRMQSAATKGLSGLS